MARVEPVILIVDDQSENLEILFEVFQSTDFDVMFVGDGASCLNVARSDHPDLILLDVMMPDIDGFEVCREIRKTSSTPVIMITARGEDFERIMGLDIGADDYIVKPFSPGEVMARVRAIMRRVAPTEGKKPLVLDNLAIDMEDYAVTIGGRSVPLTKKEIEILWTLASNRQKVFSRDNLLSSVWGYDYFGDSRTVDSHIRRLRAKLDAFLAKVRRFAEWLRRTFPVRGVTLEELAGPGFSWPDRSRPTGRGRPIRPNSTGDWA